MSGVPRDPETGDFPGWWKAREQHFMDGYQMDLWQDYPMDMLVPDNYPEVAAKLKRLITPHPAKQWTDELVLEHGGWEGLKPTYIHCVGQTYRQSSDLLIGATGANTGDKTGVFLDIRKQYASPYRRREHGNQ